MRAADSSAPCLDPKDFISSLIRISAAICALLETGNSKLETVLGMLPRLFKQFAAVLLGALLYFFVLMPHLPLSAQHQPFRLDLGLFILTWICLVLYGLIELIFRRKS